MAEFEKSVVSVPGQERIARTPFGAHIVIHATAEETGGALGMWETFTPPGQGPAPHTHTRETEVFRVIKGLYRFRCGEEEFDAAPGTVVTLPPFVPHSWRNISDQPGQMFAIVTPGGCERLFIDIEA
ncbi:MAG TPA: cupin domain-containing protein, partial [Rubellimicrobium sp.]|nr:cupin domain-containing protein [Rubellimicrobium sp.]